jgi:TetR/AcrR family transcriptional repressor of nem operon
MAPGAPAADLAQLMLAAVIGLRVLARVRPEPALLRGAARQALAALDVA